MKTIVKSLSEEHRESIQKGAKASEYNKIRRKKMVEMNIARRIKLIDTETGIIYGSEREARAEFGQYKEYEYRRTGRLQRYIKEIDNNK